MLLADTQQAIKLLCHKMNKIVKNFKNIKYGPALEDNIEVLKWIKNLPKPNHNFINGRWTKSLSRTNSYVLLILQIIRKLFDLSIGSKVGY